METGVRCYRLDGASPEALPLHAAHLDALSSLLPQGVYTTFRTYHHDKALRLDQHLARLERSAALLNRQFNLDRVALRTGLAMALDRWPEGDARVRLTLALDSPGTLYLALEQLTELPPRVYERGVSCITAPADDLRRTVPDAKSTNFIAPASRARAAAMDVNEVLLLDADEAILEGSSSNFYAVLDGALRTAGAGVLAGITRGIVLDQAASLLPVILQPVLLADLPRLQEAFLTSVSRGVLPVVAIDGQPVGAGVPGPIARELGRRFQAQIELEIEPIRP